jgi:hypothetical protein
MRWDWNENSVISIRNPPRAIKHSAHYFSQPAGHYFNNTPTMYSPHFFIFASVVVGHGIIASPPVRTVGPAMISTCGSSVTALVTADNTSHVEGMPEAAASILNFNSTACNLFMCKGLQFADNVADVQTFQPGQIVNMLASIPIPHEGPMNVSIINTKTNTAIRGPLISFVTYADESLPALPANNTNFNITIPTTLGSACSVAGTCVRFLISERIMLTA